MIFQCILLLTSIALYSHRRYQSLSAEIEIPSDIQDWCPYSRFCHLQPKDTLPQPEGHNDGTYKPCCDSCSCDPDCGLHRNCCIDELDQYRIDEKLGTVCKQLNTKVEEIPRDAYYNLVDKCPGRIDTCRMVNGTAFGSFFPVYAPASAMIYYNKYCAECHNQTDIIEFLPAFTCTDETISPLFQTILNTEGVHCYTFFIIPQNVDASSELCFPGLIQSCRETRGHDNVNRKNLSENCARFYAPYQSKSAQFKNIYCFLCFFEDEVTQETFTTEESICQGRGPLKIKGLSSLIVLFDKNTVNDYETYHEPDGEEKYVCLDTINSTSLPPCRPVYCPEGQIRVKGVCKYFGERWYAPRIQLYVKLTPLFGKLDVSKLLQITDDHITSPMQAFIYRPGLQEWEIFLWYKEQNSTIQYIVALMTLTNHVIQPSTLLDQIENSLKRTWEMNLAGEIFTLKAEINKHKAYDLYNVGKEYFWGPMGGSSLNEVRDDLLTTWSEGPQRSLVFKLDITKLFFCEQVNLYPGEFEIRAGQAYLTIQQKYIGNGEYTVFFMPHGGPRGIRLCLSDVLMDRNRSRPGYAQNDIYFVLCVSLIIILFN